MAAAFFAETWLQKWQQKEWQHTDRARDLVYVRSSMENIQAVNYVETTVELEQWAVGDSDSE